jgi:hypothetical protein
VRDPEVSEPDGARRSNTTTTIDYFERMYEVPDPWGYEASWYEQRKYAVTVASLPSIRYRRAFEPGCSIGVLTELLALRCDELISWDFHASSAARARDRVAALPHVEVAEGAVPGTWPPGTFDLIVLSEIAYYLGDGDLTHLGDRVAETVAPGGDIVLVHWRGETDYPQTGDEVHERWRADDRFEPVVDHREADFRLDVIRRRPEPDR